MIELKNERIIFHIDVNSAFLSWEATRRVAEGGEDLRLIPSVIGGNPESRTSIVAAKSIPAKKYGINTGEPVSMALRKCPGLVVAQGDFRLYKKCSKAFKAICQEYTPLMESFSIDEVFLDMSGMKNIYPDLIETAYEIKNRIRNELGFTVNVGIGYNKLCAKMASDLEKPDKVHIIIPDNIQEKMWRLDVGDLFTCGKSSAEKLRKQGIKTIGNLANANIKELSGILGANTAQHLWNYANGIDESEVSNEYREAKGYSAETTVDEDLVDYEEICKILLAQADIVSQRMRAEDGKCSCVGVTLRNLEFHTFSHQRKMENPTDVTDEIYKLACQLLKECWHGEALRLVGLSLTNITRDDFEQISLFGQDNKERLKKLDSAMDSIRGKYGNMSVRRASTMDRAKRVNRKYDKDDE